jgi:hypothetical protein
MQVGLTQKSGIFPFSRYLKFTPTKKFPTNVFIMVFVFSEIFTKRGSHENKTAACLPNFTLVLKRYLSKLGAFNFDKSEVKQKSYGRHTCLLIHYFNMLGTVFERVR